MGVTPKEKEREALPLGRRKPGRVPTSCAECRRLKLRCDKKVPCEKCVSRGCATICPDGSLTAGKHNRLVLANTEELHERIERLCERVRELEDALRNAIGPGEDHVLLRDELLGLKMPLTSTGASSSSSSPNAAASSSSPTDASQTQDSGEDTLIDSFGTLSISSNGESTFLGKTARSEFLIRALSSPTPQTKPDCPRISKKIIGATCTDSDKDPQQLGEELFRLLPPLGEAIRLCEVYLTEGGGLYHPIPREELLDEVLSGIYRAPAYTTFTSENIPQPAPSSSSTLHPKKQCIDHHLLALLYSIFALASLFDPTLPPYSIQAQEYYYLARATCSLQAPFKRTTLRGVEAALHLAIYLELSDWQALGTNSGLPVSGHALRLGLSIGLHLNSARWSLPLIQQQRRNRVFWQLFALDTWMSFSFGRPPNLAPVYIDCPFPSDEGPFASSSPSTSDSLEMSFHSWTYTYTLFIHTILQSCFSASSPSYTLILESDRKIRDFPVPLHLRPNCSTERGAGVDSGPRGRGWQGREMERMLVLCYKENTLLNLHKPFFTSLLFTPSASDGSNPGSPQNVNNQKFLPSLMATYRSAWRILQGLRHLHTVAPGKAARWGVGWSWGLSACIVLCILISRAPSNRLSHSAMEELDAALKVYEEASAAGGRSAANLLETIRCLHKKAKETLSSPTTIPLDRHLTEAELDRLGGKTRLVSPVPNPYSDTSSDEEVEEVAMHATIAEDMDTFGPGFFDGNVPAHAPESSTSGSGAFDFDFGVGSAFSGGGGGTGVGGTELFGVGSPGVLSGMTMGMGMGMGTPVLDASWQSFVEQLGF
ncbi:hypothetical protein Moror_11062 [Moniliophthora roreri MCA 2997]|uniref:Zn(2)-C6 fungal-type domain-containing protein n=1 Tax=Moniliophthora roreri (strain MCA 2997) TaxID=1381753 RepID=V2WW29_MONRO|nr:hypothetical protein Moror_11062 [Moniliophthora roreri MCA 2997]